MWTWIDTALLAFNGLMLLLNLAVGSYGFAAVSGLGVAMGVFHWGETRHG